MRSCVHSRSVRWAAAFLIFLSSSALAPTTVHAQAGASRTLRGEVRDSVSGEALSGIEVRLGDKTATTDAEGRFEISAQAPPFKLTLRRAGESAVTRTVTESEAASIFLLTLDPPIRRAEEVSVFDSRKDDPAPASLQVRPQQVLEVAGAVDNIFRALHTLPGVAATEEFGSRLAVRGGTPDQNLTIMDGIEIHNPYRLFGLTSAFNPETVQSFELSAGAFSAKYGDRLSSILLVENRDGATNRRLQGSTTLSITDGNVLAEGPWPAKDKGSWLVSARRTYYDLIAERLIDEDLPGFQDLQYRAAYDVRPGTRVTAFGIRSREAGDARFDGDDNEFGAFVTAAKNDVFGFKARSLFGTRVTSTLALASYGFEQTLSVDAEFEDGSRRSNGRTNETLINIDFDQTTATRDLSVRNDWAIAASPRHLVETGFEFHRLRTGASYEIRGDRNLSEANGSSNRGGTALPDFYDETLRSNRWGAYVLDRVTMTPRFSFEGGLRFERSSMTRNVEVQPRLSFLVRQGEATRFRLAYGSHSQSPGIEKLLQADYFLDLSMLGLRNERAKHLTTGFERDFAGFGLRAEAYWKSFDDLIAGALESEAARAARVASYDFPKNLESSIVRTPLITTTPQNGGSGRSYGLEFVATKPRRGDDLLSGWASYTFGKATKTLYGRNLPFEYDRRHALSIVGHLTPNEKLDIGFTVRAASGFPRTKPLGVRVVPIKDALDRDKDGNVTELVPELDAVGLPVYTANFGGVSNLLGSRYPVFARLDLRINVKPRGERSRWLFYLEFINATNRKNVGMYETSLRPVPGGTEPEIRENPGSALPFLPTFGVRFRF